MRGASLAARLLEPGLDLLAIPLRWQGRAILERRPDLAQGAVAGLERQRFSRRERFDLSAELLQAPQVLLLLPGASLLVFDLFLLESGDGAFESLGRNQIGRGVFAQHVGIPAQPTPARDHIFHRLFRRSELLELGGERLEPADRRFGEQPSALAILEGARGILKASRQ